MHGPRQGWRNRQRQSKHGTNSLTFHLRAGAEAVWKEEASTTDTSGHAQRSKILAHCFFMRSGPQTPLRTCMSAVDSVRGRILAVALQGKDRKDKYVVKMLVGFSRLLGLERAFLQTDPENAAIDRQCYCGCREADTHGATREPLCNVLNSGNILVLAFMVCSVESVLGVFTLTGPSFAHRACVRFGTQTSTRTRDVRCSHKNNDALSSTVLRLQMRVGSCSNVVMSVVPSLCLGLCLAQTSCLTTPPPT